MGHVPDGKTVEEGVIMSVGQRRRGREDYMGVPGGFVSVKIHTDHEIKRR